MDQPTPSPQEPVVSGTASAFTPLNPPPGNRKDQLLGEIEASRSDISDAATTISSKVDPIARVGRSVKENPAAWAVGAAAFGFVAAALVLGGGRRREPRERRSSILAAPLAMAISAVRPQLTEYARKQLTTYLNQALDSRRPPT